MEYCQYNDASRFETKIDAVRESARSDTPNVIVNDRICFRLLRRERDTSINFSNEFGTKTRTLGFVSQSRRNKFCARSAMNFDP